MIVANETAGYFCEMVSSGYDREILDIYELMREVVTACYSVLEKGSDAKEAEMLRRISKESSGKEFLRSFFRYELRSKELSYKDKLKLTAKKLLRGRRKITK